MASINLKFRRYFFLVVIFVLLCQTECRRTSSGGSRGSSHSSRGTSHSSSHSSHGSHTSHSGGYGSSHSSHGGGFGTSHGGGGFGTSHGSGGFGTSHGSGGLGTSHGSGGFGTSHGTSHGSGGFGTSHGTGGFGSGGFGTSQSGGGFGSNTHGSAHGTGFTGSGIQSTHTVTGGIGFRPPQTSGTTNTANNANKPGSIGFENVHNRLPPGPNQPPTSGVHGPVGTTHTGGERFHQTSATQVGSANKPGIGFDNVNHNQQQNSRKDIGFENVHNRLPPGPNQPITPGVHHPVGSGNIGTHNTFSHNNNPNYQRPYPVQGGTHYQYPQHGSATYHPYQPQTVVFPGGGVQYHPPLQPQYTPPISHSYIPVYQPVPIYQSSPSYSSGRGGSLLGYGGSFLGGYLVGRVTGGMGSHDHHYYHHHSYDNNNYNRYNDRDDYYGRSDYSSGRDGYSGGGDTIYTVHHYHQNREQVPPKFSVPDDSTVECSNASRTLCVPNTDPICLKNGTIMCVTNIPYTVPCGTNSSMACVYTKIDCAGNPECNTTANQTYVEFYLPCISNVTLVNNRVLDDSFSNLKSSYELCVTAIANPKKLESPVGALATFVLELGKWHFNDLKDTHYNITHTN